jgi:hypothetical protein
MPKARPIERHHPVMLGHQVEQAARGNLLNHAAIAVKEHDRGFTCAPPDVMQPHAIDRPRRNFPSENFGAQPAARCDALQRRFRPMLRRCRL